MLGEVLLIAFEVARSLKTRSARLYIEFSFISDLASVDADDLPNKAFKSLQLGIIPFSVPDVNFVIVHASNSPLV